MHFLICLIFGMFLLAEGAGSLPVSTGRVLLAVALVTASPILLAWLQALELVRNRRLAGPLPEVESRALRQADWIHLAAWAGASLAGIWLMHWPTLVKSTWALQGWLLLDELLVIAPPLFSLLASWLVFELTLYPDPATVPVGAVTSERVHLPLWAVWTRSFPMTTLKFQHSLGFALLPLLVLFSIRDLCGGAQASVHSMLLAGGAGLLAVVICYPIYLKWLLPSEPIQLPLIEGEADGLELRKWHTHGLVYNALVTGLIPGCQTVFVSDGLLRFFPPEEVAAIVRHELAHVRRGHLLWRSLAIAGPLLVLLISSAVGLPAGEYLLLSGARLEPWGILLLAGGLAGWTWGVIRPLSHRIEYEADHLATLDPSTGLVNPERRDALRSALLRLGHGFPEQFRRKTLFHPSLELRLRRLATSPVRPISPSDRGRAD